MQLSKYLLLAYLLNCAAPQSVLRTFKMTNVNCEVFNKSWGDIKECRLRVKSRNIVAAYIKLDTFFTINKLDVRILVLKRANGYKPFVIDYRVDFCKYAKDGQSKPALILFKLIEDFINYNKCPIKEGELKIDGFYPKFEKFLLPFPSGEYMISLEWYANKYKALKIDVYFIFST